MLEENVQSLTCDSCGSKRTYKDKYKYQRALKEGSTLCRACNAKVQKPCLKKENNPAWKGYKGMPYNWFSKYFERGKKKHKGTITLEYVYEIYIKQGKKCALTGLPLPWSTDEKGRTITSVDRIDSKLGYHEGNIQLVHKDINKMKGDFEMDYLLKLCKLVTKNGSV